MRRKRIYDHPAWRITRRNVLERDGHRCQIRGPHCTGRATEVDHITPIVEGGAPFDPDNLRASCSPCNSGRTSRRKAENGWRSAATRIHLVTGPPAAGKSTWVNEHRNPGDIVIDLDAIAQAVGSDTGHDHGQAQTSAARIARAAIIRQLRRGDIDTPHAWLIATHPDAADIYPHHEHTVIDPGQDETHRRADLAGRPARWHQLIDDWYTATAAATSASRAW